MEYKVDALKLASKDARNKAGAIAEGQERKLGRLVSLGSQEFNYGGPVMYYASEKSSGSAAPEARDAAVSIQPREFEVSATVSASYKLS